MSKRRVDDLVAALGVEGIAKSQVSELAAALHAEPTGVACLWST